jgi:hypothetical protein
MRRLLVRLSLPGRRVMDLPPVGPGAYASLRAQEPEGWRYLVFHLSPGGEASLGVLQVSDVLEIGAFRGMNVEDLRCERAWATVGETYTRAVQTRWGPGTLQMTLEEG